MTAALTKKTLFCFPSRQSYCQELRETFFLKLKLFRFLAVCLEPEGNAKRTWARSKSTTFCWEGFFFNYFSDIKEIALGAKYIWTDSQRVYLPKTSGRQANLLLIWGEVGFFLNAVTFQLNFSLQS